MLKLMVVLAFAAAAGSWGCGDGSMEAGGVVGASPAGQGMMANGSAGVSLVGMAPAAGMQGVPVDTPLEVRFSAPMPSSMEVQMDLHLGDLSGPAVALGCVPSTDRTRLTCTPGTALRPGTTYVTHMGGGMGVGGYACGSDTSMMGGKWVMGGGMMTPTHGGMSWNGMGSWADGCGGYGMAFPFTTA
jgi:hypothetical protein